MDLSSRLTRSGRASAEETRTSPVRPQMMMVQKVPVYETSPYLTAFRVLAVAATMGSDPMPASLEKSPRATPYWAASMKP